MESQKRIKELMAEALDMVKKFDANYKDLKINDQTVLLGNNSDLESIAFTVFVTHLEEKIEAEIGSEFSLNIGDLLDRDPQARKAANTTLELMAGAISRHLESLQSKS